MSQENPYQSPESVGNVEAEICEKMEFFSWSQRIGRVRYLAYAMGLYLVFALVSGVVFGISAAISAGEPGLFAWILMGLGYIAFIVGLVTLQVRRLHDLGQSGLWWLVSFVPFLNIALVIYLLFFPGTDTVNKYGPRPLPNTAGTWIGGLLPIVVLGILAAIAIPAYQDYMERAQQSGYQG